MDGRMDGVSDRLMELLSKCFCSEPSEEEMKSSGGASAVDTAGQKTCWNRYTNQHHAQSHASKLLRNTMFLPSFFWVSLKDKGTKSCTKLRPCGQQFRQRHGFAWLPGTKRCCLRSHTAPHSCKSASPGRCHRQTRKTIPFTARNRSATTVCFLKKMEAGVGRK